LLPIYTFENNNSIKNHHDVTSDEESSTTEEQNLLDPIMSEMFELFTSSDENVYDPEKACEDYTNDESLSFIDSYPKVPNPLEQEFSSQWKAEENGSYQVSESVTTVVDNPLLSITTTEFIPLAPKLESSGVVSRSSSIYGSISVNSCSTDAKAITLKIVSTSKVSSSLPLSLSGKTKTDTTDDNEAFRSSVKERNRIHAHQSRIRRKTLTQDLQTTMAKIQNENTMLRNFITRKLSQTNVNDLLQEQRIKATQHFVEQFCRDPTNRIVKGKTLRYLRSLRNKTVKKQTNEMNEIMGLSFEKDDDDDSLITSALSIAG
jgi:biopolymer transport protein ExbD